MVDRGLSGSPLAVSIRNWRVLGKHAGDVPEEEVRVVSERLCVESMIVHDDRSVVLKTTSETSNDEVGDPGIGDPASNVEVADGELTDDGKSEEATELSARCVVGPVEVGSVNGAGNFLHSSTGEPASEDIEVLLGLGGPLRELLSKDVLGHTETDKIVVLNVVGSLGVNCSSNSIIVGVLISL